MHATIAAPRQMHKRRTAELIVLNVKLGENTRTSLCHFKNGDESNKKFEGCIVSITGIGVVPQLEGTDRRKHHVEGIGHSQWNNTMRGI